MTGASARSLALAGRVAASVAALAVLAILWFATFAVVTPFARIDVTGYFQPPSDDPLAGMANARVIVKATPLDPDAMAYLAVAGARSSDPSLTVRALTVGGALGWRNPIVQAFWLNTAIQAGDLQVAAQRLAALMAMDADRALWKDALVEVSGTADGRAALADRLAQSTLSLMPLLVKVPDDEREATILGNRLNLVALAHGKGMKVDCVPMAQLESAVVMTSAAGDGERLWYRLCDRQALVGTNGRNLSTAGSVVDYSSPFQWITSRSGNFNVGYSNNQAGDVDMLVSSSSTIPETFAYRSIILPVGDYRITWDATDDNGMASDAIMPRVRCQNAAVLPLTPLPAAGVTAGARFTVPSSECPVLTIALTISPPSSSQITYSQLTLRNIRVVPAS